MEDSDRLKEGRKRLGMTQKKLAEELGIHTMSLSRLERGEVPVQRQTLLAVRCLIHDAGLSVESQIDIEEATGKPPKNK